MKKRLVFVHGRAQENKDPVALKAEWIAAWERGLQQCGLSMPIGDGQIELPYYGDKLYKEVYGLPADEVIWRGEKLEENERLFIRSILDDVVAQAGITSDEVDSHAGSGVIERGIQNWDFTLSVARAIDNRFGPLASVAIITMAEDVHSYLQKSTVQTLVDSIVKPAFASGEQTIVVGHSLGSVVAYKILEKFACPQGCTVPLFLTLGSPLAINHIRKLLAPIKRPGCVGKWINARDKSDAVALYPLQAPHFSVEPAVENYSEVRNSTENRHGIVGYLDDPEIARILHDALI